MRLGLEGFIIVRPKRNVAILKGSLVVATRELHKRSHGSADVGLMIPEETMTDTPRVASLRELEG
jgi:hypothetical protein